MAIPNTSIIQQALLTALADQQEHRMVDLVSTLGKTFALTDEDLNERYTVSGELKFPNKVWWARNSLLQADLLHSPKRGSVQITLKGKAALHTKQPDLLTSQTDLSSTTQIETDPQDVLDTAMAQLTRHLQAEVLKHVRQMEPQHFEKLVVDLLLAMGYGFDKKTSGQTTKRSADGGVDGLVHEDKLRLSSIYIQAKRYSATTSVTASEIRDFVGTLDLNGANKGVFITTSDFTAQARQTLDKASTKKIVLINGEQLARLMIENGVGVSTTKTLRIQHIDSDYFRDVLTES